MTVRTYPGSTVTFEVQNLNSSGVPTAADTVTLSTKVNKEDQTAIAAGSITTPSTGVYQYIATPTKPGVIRAFWTLTTSGVISTTEQVKKIHDTKFEVA